ncbi:MAG: tetraacyldisaccharide 4'-kinase [Dysgonomonas sp.]|nr:tetraacyldisaccharide 4'-kinase [Dysgonomonas sp.]
MANKNVYINKWLLPFSWLYGFIVFIRNKLFDWKILKQKEYDIPVICVGNITVGGTGKTPHIEYLVKLLEPHYKVAVLSRGYKRKTSGFVLATTESNALDIGDEPYQIKNKFPDILVAVDSKRQRGIETLLSLPPKERPNVILLDDAFQHRYVKPSYSILLTDYNRLMSSDELLPAGRLREPAYYAEKANMVIVTKCPPGVNPLELRLTANDLHVYPYQDLFYTTFRYGELTPVFGNSEDKLPLNALKDKEVIVLTGIVNPRPMHRIIRKQTRKLLLMQYPDHYDFKKKDIEDLKVAFNNIPDDNKLIVTTEKDAARLRSMKKLDDNLKKAIYYLPIQVVFINEGEQDLFDSKIIEHAGNKATPNL